MNRVWWEDPNEIDYDSGFDEITPMKDPYEWPLTCPVCNQDTFTTGLNCTHCGELDYDKQGNWFAVDPGYALETGFGA